MWGGIVGGMAAYMEAFSKLSPEQQTAVRAAWKREREIAALEASPEVRLAREYIATLEIHGEYAERLLDFARHLARRVVN